MIYFVHHLIETGHISESDDCGVASIEINQCAAYDVPSLIRQKVFMETNPAYEEITRRFTVTSWKLILVSDM